MKDTPLARCLKASCDKEGQALFQLNQYMISVFWLFCIKAQALYLIHVYILEVFITHYATKAFQRQNNHQKLETLDLRYICR